MYATTQNVIGRVYKGEQWLIYNFWSKLQATDISIVLEMLASYILGTLMA